MADSLSSITGLSSGVDWKGLVDQIVKAERAPADRMQATVDANTARKDAYNALQATFKKLQTASDALRFGGAFNKFAASAAGTDADGRAVLAAAVGAGAAPGSYTVEVTQLAQTQKNAGSVGFTGAKVALGMSGALMVGAQRVEVAATDTLAGVRDKINAVSAQSGVRAAVVAGSADGGDARLVLTATKGGSAGAFAVADDPATAAAFGGAEPYQAPAPSPAPTTLAAALGVGAATTAAQDARLVVDGVGVTRSTNVVGDAVPGVTLTLGAVGTSALTVDREPGAAADAVKAFVDAYNEVRQAVAAQRTVGADGKLPPLYGEAIPRQLAGTLPAVLLGTSPTANADGTSTGVQADLATFSAVGVSIQRDGTLAFDAAKFGTAYQDRLADLQAVLADRAQAVSTVVDAAANPFLGSIDTRERALDAQSGVLKGRILDVDARLDKKRQSLLAQYARFEAALGRMKALGDTMTAQFNSLNSSSNSNS